MGASATLMTRAITPIPLSRHFTPKPAQLELEVVTAKDTPAIEMEEVTPAHVSSAATLAPHEVFAPKKSELELKATEELSSAEKAKLRKAAKLRNRREKDRRAKDRKLIEKLNPGLGNKFTVGKAMQELTKKENAGVCKRVADVC